MQLILEKEEKSKLV